MPSKQVKTAREISEMNHFDSMAKNYDTNYTYDTPFTQYKIQKKLTTLFKNVNKKKKLHILEIGAGTGEYTQYLAAMFPKAQIIAIDISPQILKVAQKKCKHYKNLKFEVASVYNLPYKDQTFDVVCGFYILHHLDLHQSISEIHRVLKPKSSALFYEPNLLNPVVFAIKNIPYLKKRVGDSPEESAINPLSLAADSQPFSSLDWQTTEFLVLPSSLPVSLAITLDKVSSWLGSLPLLNVLGGSVRLDFTKR